MRTEDVRFVYHLENKKKAGYMFIKEFSYEELYHGEAKDEIKMLRGNWLINDVTIEHVNKDPHEVSQVKCDLCGKEWVAVRPEGLTELECPNCENMVHFENI